MFLLVSAEFAFGDLATIGTQDFWNGFGWAAVGNGQALAQQIRVFQPVDADSILVQAYTSTSVNSNSFEVTFSDDLGPGALILGQETFSYPVSTPDTLQSFLLPLDVQLQPGNYYVVFYSGATIFNVGSPLGFKIDSPIGEPGDVFVANNGGVGSIDVTSPVKSTWADETSSGRQPWNSPGSPSYGDSLRFQLTGETDATAVTPEPGYSLLSFGVLLIAIGVKRYKQKMQ